MSPPSSEVKERDSMKVKRGKPHAAESPIRVEELLQAYFKNRLGDFAEFMSYVQGYLKKKA